MKLTDLRDNPGARVKKTLLGRGVGSGKGKTCARGGKGQTARSGVRIGGFEGGQTPTYRRLPKRGFTNIHARRYAEVNVGAIQAAVDAGRLLTDQKIDALLLKKVGVIKHIRDGVRLLGDGVLSAKVSIVVAGATQRACAIIAQAGGQVMFVKG